MFPEKDKNLLEQGFMMYYSEDGVHYCPIPKVPMDFIIPELDPKDYIFDARIDFSKEQDITIYGYLRFPHQKMSRKTFKKWLMGHKISRDDADWLCWVVSEYHGKVSYSDIYRKSLFMPSFDYIFDNIMKQGDSKAWTKK